MRTDVLARMVLALGATTAMVSPETGGAAAHTRQAQTGLSREEMPPAPRFSIEHMDQSDAPGADFYRYANGTWLKNNPVPPDKSRWGSFMELQGRNWLLIREILDSLCNAPAQPGSPARQLADFYQSALNTNRVEKLGFKPLARHLARIDALQSGDELLRLLADLHERGIRGCFARSAIADEKNSAVYAWSE